MKIHILGIVGQMTTPLALALQKQGHEITGSDQDKIYPPFSDILNSHQIPINQPLGNPDLVIVGSAFKHFQRCQEEFAKIQKRKLPFISATNYLAQNLVKPESILIAGSFGKTTTAGLMAHIFSDSNYFFGGQAVSNLPSLQFSSSSISCLEADESINGLDEKAKFLYYPVKYLILTSTHWEHHDSYPTASENLLAYQHLLENIPPEGVLVYNPDDEGIKKIIHYCRAKTQLPYVNKTFDTPLLGNHNQKNIAAVYTLCRQLGVAEKKLLSAISQYQGIKRRMEILSYQPLIIDDFAQSAPRVFEAIKSIKEKYPQKKIVVYFESHASFLQKKDSLNDFNKIYPLINQFILASINISSDKDTRVTSHDWQLIFREKFKYLPLATDLISYIQQNLSVDDTLIHFSSGGQVGFTNLQKIIYTTKAP